MATTAKKTSKKPVKKTAAKQTKAAASPARASSKRFTSRKPLSLDSLRRLNLVSAVASAALAVASAMLLVPSSSVQMVMSYMTSNTLASADKVVLAPASRVIWEPELRYLLAAIFGLAAIGSLLLATSLKKRYSITVTNETSGFRWLFVGISSALLLEFASLLAGVQDIATLKLVGALVMGASLLCWLAERENRGTGGVKWLAYAFALVAGTLAWIPLVMSMIGTGAYGIERFSWYVYAFAGVVLVGFIGFALNLYQQILGKKQWKNYLFAEQGYLAIDLTMKIAALVVIAFALHR